MRAWSRSASGALPAVGDLVPFLRDKLGFLERAARQHGDVVELALAQRTFLLAHPIDIAHVLVDNADNYRKSPRIGSSRGQRVGGVSLITVEGDRHDSLRRPLLPLMRVGTLQPFVPRIQREIARVTATWHDGATIDLCAATRRIALECAIRLFLGDRLVDSSPQLAESVEIRRRFMLSFYGSLRPWPERWPLALNRRYRRVSRRMDSVLDESLAAGDDSLLTLLGAGETPRIADALRGQVFTLLVSAYETLADHLAWLCFVLAGGEQGEAPLQGEIAAVGRYDSDYADRFLAEVLRLYPPTWMFVRIARAADVLPSGATVPSGTKIYLSQWVTQRDARFFPEPDRFDPSRFLPEVARQRPRFSYFPFGGGRRHCIGEPLARLVASQLLAAIVPRWRLELRTPSIVPVASVTLTPSAPITAVLHSV